MLKKKKRYKIRNWREYNQSLKKRYRLNLLIPEDIYSHWYAEPSGARGAPRHYGDIAITVALTLRTLFNLPLRGCEGLVASILELLKLELDAPDYSTLSRRGNTLDVKLPHFKSKENIWLVADSSGLKIYGEGEWKVRMHGIGKRRTWRKLHIAVNANTGEIEAGVLTTADVHDSEVLDDLLSGKEGQVEAVAADGAYDTRDGYQSISRIGAKAVIPPRRGARIWEHGNGPGPPVQRDENLRYIRKHGRKKWKEESGYHRRSLAETGIFRIKTIFTDKLRSRTFDNQATEAFLRLSLLNRMTALGMPESYPVDA